MAPFLIVTMTESTQLEVNAHVRIDEYGFFLYWLIESRDAVVLDIGQVWEARPSGLPKDGRVLFELEQRGARETLEERTIWITHGQDLVNVQSFYLVAETVEIAKLEMADAECKRSQENPDQASRQDIFLWETRENGPEVSERSWTVWR
ncbi:hypothetical protein COOONC_02289 [Cooperia oncophora]